MLIIQQYAFFFKIRKKKVIYYQIALNVFLLSFYNIFDIIN